MKWYAYSIVLFITAMSPGLLHAQDELYLKEGTLQETDRKGKLYLVPEVSLWLGTYTNIEAAPQLGYHLTDRISVGAGVHYMYYRTRDYIRPVASSTQIWGIKGFSRISVIRNASNLLPFYLFDELFLHTEYERMYLDNSYFNIPNQPAGERFPMDYLYAGLGFSQLIGPYSSYTILLLWNLNDTFYSLYSNPTYRIGLNIYF